MGGAEAETQLAKVRALATSWATQPTDYDEDTEQQIQDGIDLLAILGLVVMEVDSRHLTEVDGALRSYRRVVAPTPEPTP